MTEGRYAGRTAQVHWRRSLWSLNHTAEPCEVINADKPSRWKADIATSVDLYNDWFLKFAPMTFQETRKTATDRVVAALVSANDLSQLTPATLKASPEALAAFRMTAAPPLARDRLAGSSDVPRGLVKTLEEGKIPRRIGAAMLDERLERICRVLMQLVDRDIFVWLEERRLPTEPERFRASTIVADRLCGSQSDPIIRNAQEQRQLALIESFLIARGYHRQAHPPASPITTMPPGTFTFRFDLLVGTARHVKLPIDVVIQPHAPRPSRIPILIEAKSAGDFTNPNKRRKEEATKIRQIQEAYGMDASLVLFLCGYFDSGYLGYEAAEGMDWVWEHRIDDIVWLGL